MTLGALLDQIRAQYLEDFQAKIDEELAGVGVRLIAEPALRLASGEIAGEGPWKLPMRKDLALLQGSRPAGLIDVDARRATTFEAIEFTWGERLEVELASLRWQQAFVEMSGAGRFEWEPLISWFWRWFKKDIEGGRELLGVVHFLSDPLVTNEVASFEVDLGSAPVGAFEELLDAIASTGAVRCRFGARRGRAGS
jgi:hypothetical protein